MKQTAAIKGGQDLRELPNLDLMRSLAVCLVITAHVLLYAQRTVPFETWFFGLLGVDIFFVHTTLVLMWSLERDPHTARFLLRRAFRIYPLWLTVLFLSVAVRLPTSPAFAPNFRFLHPTFRVLAENALLIFNLTHLGAGLIGASWSLPVEMQMYIVLPFLFFAIRSMRSLGALILLNALTVAVAYAIDPSIASDLLFCAPCFLPGAMAYLGFQQRTPRLPGWCFVLWLLTLAEVTNLYASRHHSFRGGWIFALALGCSLPSFRQITFRPLIRLCELIARYSYGFYLFHFAALAVGLHYLIGYPLGVRLLGFFTTLIGLSVVFYHLVEKPMIKAGSRLARRIGNAPEPRMTQAELSLEMAP